LEQLESAAAAFRNTLRRKPHPRLVDTFGRNEQCPAIPIETVGHGPPRQRRGDLRGIRGTQLPAEGRIVRPQREPGCHAAEAQYEYQTRAESDPSPHGEITEETSRAGHGCPQTCICVSCW